MKKTFICLVSVLGISAAVWGGYQSQNPSLDSAIIENIEALSEAEASGSHCCKTDPGQKCWYKEYNADKEMRFSCWDGHSALAGCR